MIFILSEKFNTTSDKVIEWLLYYKHDYIRVNNDDRVELLELTVDYFIIKAKNKIVDSRNITSYFYNRGEFNIENSIYVDFKSDDATHEFIMFVNEFNKKEVHYILEHIYLILDRIKNKIGSIFQSHINKLNVLYLAQKYGLNIPDTLITSNMAIVKKKFGEDRSLITKTIAKPFRFSYDSKTLKSYTTIVESQAAKFNYSLFQNNIYKKYEIRIFYFDGKLYSTAIFSQNNDNTKIDCRQNARDKPIRYVPYQLSITLEKKISKLIRKCKLDICSIDMIKSIDSKYYFLEINPVGQFGAISAMCNYSFELLIAKKLTNL